MIKLIDGSLDIAIPYLYGHVVTWTGQNVGVIWRKLYFPNCETVLHQSHQWLIDVGPQIEDFDQVISTGSRDEVFVFVEVDWEHIIVMCVNLLHIFAGSHVPDTSCFVSGTSGEDALVCWVPDWLIDGTGVLEASSWAILQSTRVPKLRRHIHGSREYKSFINVIPFAALNFSLMAAQYARWLRWPDLPEFKRAIASSWEHLVLIRFWKADIKTRIRRLECLNDLHRPSTWTCLHNRNCTCANNSEVLTLC